MVTGQQDGTTSEESIPYPVVEKEMSDKQQKVSRRNPKVNAERNNSDKRTKRTTQEIPEKQPPLNLS